MMRSKMDYVLRQAEKLSAVETATRMKYSAAFGAGVGAMGTVTDKKDDGVVGLTAKTAVGAAAGVGLTHGVALIGSSYAQGIGNNKVLDSHQSSRLVSDEAKKGDDLRKEMKRVEAEGEATKVAQNAQKHDQVTTGKIEKESVKAKHDSGFNRQLSERRAKNWLGKAQIVSAIGMGAFALASTMDVSDRMGDDKRATRMKEEQERNLKRKQTREERKRAEQGYGHVDMGQMAIDLFNERLGHHKMGNAKFQ